MVASLSFPDRFLRPIPAPLVLSALRRRYSTSARALCKLILSALSTNRSNSALSLFVIVPWLFLSSRLVILACVTGSSFKRLNSGFSNEINSLKSTPKTKQIGFTIRAWNFWSGWETAKRYKLFKFTDTPFSCSRLWSARTLMLCSANSIPRFDHSDSWVPSTEFSVPFRW